MKRPAFQFYPGDWLRNANLRRCSHAARGAWMDVLCVLHDSDEYGLIRWPLADLANACAAPIKLLRELVDKGVLKGCDKGQCEPFIYTPRSGRKDGDPVTLVAQQAGPIWYSSRMVKDEYVRTIRGESSRFGDSPDKPPKATPKASPKPPIGDGSTSASATAVSESASALSAREVTPAGAVGIALKAAGIDPQTINLSDPVITELIAQGATPEEFAGLAREAVASGKRNPMKWVLAVLPERRKDAASVRLAPPGRQGTGNTGPEWARQRDAAVAAYAGPFAAKPAQQSLQHPTEEVVDVSARRVG